MAPGILIQEPSSQSEPIHQTKKIVEPPSIKPQATVGAGQETVQKPADVVAKEERGKATTANDSAGEVTKPTQHSLHVVDTRTGLYYNLPIYRNSINASLFKQLKAPHNVQSPADQDELGLRIFDPGFGNTAVSESEITYIDGNRGVIQYRGYDIGDIIDANKGYVDVAHLLIWGHWPTQAEAAQLQADLNAQSKLPESVLNTIRAFPPKSSIIGMMIAGLSALQSCEMDAIPAHVAKNLYLGQAKAVDEQIVRFMSAFPAIAAAAYCHYQGRELGEPRKDLSYIENFFVMTGHVDESTGLPNPHYVKNFERLWVLIADHEMTCSTAALLQTASALPDVISSMISAISALYGPLHGGAIEVAYKNIEAIGSVENIPTKIERVKSGKERLFGYGHRIYRVEDPRYIHIRRILDTLSTETEQDPLLRVAFELDRVASEDEYFIKRKLRPNADLFAAFTYKAMGFPCEFILPLSITSRMQGFMAHWREAMVSGSARIWRPQQLYTGELNKKF